MQASPTVLIMSDDGLLRELLGGLLRQERFGVCEAADVAEAGQQCEAERPGVILIDAVEDAVQARLLLDDPWTALGDVQPSLVLLAGSATPGDVRDHGYLDRVLTVPLRSEELVKILGQHASGRARRQMRSGVQLRATVAQTFATKHRVRNS